MRKSEDSSSAREGRYGLRFRDILQRVAQACHRPGQQDLVHHLGVLQRDKTDQEIETDIEEFKDTQELIKADCAEPKAIAYYRKQGFRMRACRKFKGSRAIYTKK